MESDKLPTTTSLLFRNFIFTVLQPGLVAGVIPYYMVRGRVDALEKPFHFHLYAGLLLLVVGLIVMLRCIIQFALEGMGTLSPADPTKRLVVRGLYQYSRNPMYVGVTMILTGEAILTQSASLWIYLAIVFICFNLFIIFREEPRLRRDFGEEYNVYSRKVRRWI
jgi:protein-S-isoprenylcysteine O-methyltransferase Ste14